jgi:RND family efflux transporter MFP subunit
MSSSIEAFVPVRLSSAGDGFARRRRPASFTARRVLVGFAALLTSVAGVRVVTAQEGGPPPTAVRVAPVIERVVQDRAQLTGEVRATEKTTVAADGEGRVLEVLVQEGDHVDAGAPLARLDDTTPRLSLLRLEARRAVADAVQEVRQAEFDRAELDLKRLEQLAADRASRPRELDDARSEVAITRARLLQARRDLEVIDAEMAIVRDELDDAVITAPFAGTVIARHTDPGRWMERGGDVVGLVGDGRFEIWLDVPQRYRTALASEDATVGARVDSADRSWPPARPIIVPLVDPDARSFRVYLRVTDETGLLADGMSALGSVPAGQSARRLLVPRDALLQNAAGFYLFAVRGTGEGPPSAMPVPVRVLFELGRDVAISGAIGPGEMVVVEGNERLFPMMPVAPTPIDLPPAEPAAASAASAAGRD